MMLDCFFFFSSRRRHTRWTGDWSSDVCSSDLERLRSVARSRVCGLRGATLPQAGRRDTAEFAVAEPLVPGVHPVRDIIRRGLDGTLLDHNDVTRLGSGVVQGGTLRAEIDAAMADICIALLPDGPRGGVNIVAARGELDRVVHLGLREGERAA